MKRTRVISAIAGACLFAFSTGAFAQQTGQLDIPRTISYQGMLTSTNGTPLADGQQLVTVTLYADPAGTIPLWQETQNTTITNGIFNLYLGTTQPLPSSAELNRPLWVGTALNGELEMRPLTPLAASPYALNLPDHAVTTGKLADGAVTADKVEMDYVKGFRVNGQEISAKGAILDIRGSQDIALSYDEATGSLQIGQADDNARDGEKGASVQDVTDASNNWLGRNAGLNQPSFTAPVGNYNTLAGGASNTIGSGEDYSTITGGQSNSIQYPSGWAFIGGGESNSIVQGAGGTISGGKENTLTSASAGGANYSTIAGGESNNIESQYSAIGGGLDNTITAYNGTVGGGRDNTVSDLTGTIGGGYQNTVAGYDAVIGGGAVNNINSGAYQATIAGGGYNTVAANAFGSAVGGGIGNLVEAENSTISGGSANTIATSTSHYSTISGGRWNKVGNVGDPALSGTVGGGENNFVYADYSTIAGGNSNIIETGVPNSFIGGGRENKIFISTGQGVAGSVIAGGQFNNIESNAGLSTIGGGSGNKVSPYVGIPNPNFLSATIPGGDNLIAQSWAQTVVGGWNLPKGTVAPRAGAGANRKEPIFIIGSGFDNGTGMTKFNAFEVSYNGHSTVYHTNGTGAATPAIRGTSYTDNTVYAWAYAVPAAAIPMGGTVEVQCDFGVANIQYINTGHYLVTMNLEKPEDDGTFSPMQLDCGSVTASIVMEGPACAVINTSRITGNAFNVYISDFSCHAVDLPFTFKVTGRP